MNNVTRGMDLGDKNHVITILDEDGVIAKSCSLDNVRASIVKSFKKYQGSTVAIEAGTHSPWISRELKALGCNVLVGKIHENSGPSGTVMTRQMCMIQKC